MEYDASTMGRWYLPCPHCEEYTPLKFENLTWNEVGEEVKMVCPHCGGMAEEWEWKRDNQKKENGYTNIQKDFRNKASI